MTKRQLIDEITTLNPTAAPAFLAGFRDQDLAEYLTHLRWVVPPNVIVERASGAPADRSPAGDPLPVSESGAASACIGPVSAADAPAVAAAVRAALIRNAWRTPYAPVFKTHVQEPQPQVQQAPAAEAQAERQGNALAVLTDPVEESAAPVGDDTPSASCVAEFTAPAEALTPADEPAEQAESVQLVQQADSAEHSPSKPPAAAARIARPRQEEEKGAYLF